MSACNVLTPSFIEERSIPVPESGCWLWDGFIRLDGYGHLRSLNKKVLAHRAAYIAFMGTIPEGYIVRHKCDTRQCVNPNHLELGNQQDNIDDRNKRGRTARGAKVQRTKLSDEDVVYIRHSSEDHKSLAQKYNVQVGYIRRIIRGLERPYV